MAKIDIKNTTEYIVAVGTLNVGLTVVGINVVEMLAGIVNLPIVATIVYVIVGVSGAYLLAKKLKLMK